eukprot:ANDGO_06612.mRNA.1 Deoxyribose-phosphate aldolase
MPGEAMIGSAYHSFVTGRFAVVASKLSGTPFSTLEVVESHVRSFVASHILPSNSSTNASFPGLFSDLGTFPVNQVIDHTILKAQATSAEIAKLCNEALQNSFASVCINSSFVPFALSILQNRIKVCTVIGFPLGATSTVAKRAELVDAVSNGASEVDVVVPVGRVLDGDYQYVLRELQEMRSAIQTAESARAKTLAEGTSKVVLKVIFETCYLSKEQVADVAILCALAGVDFVKTSTGFGDKGAQIDDVRIMASVYYYGLAEHSLQHVDWAEYGVKASGGIRDWDACQTMIKEGATRIGASAGLAILKQQQAARQSSAAPNASQPQLPKPASESSY